MTPEAAWTHGPEDRDDGNDMGITTETDSVPPGQAAMLGVSDGSQFQKVTGLTVFFQGLGFPSVLTKIDAAGPSTRAGAYSLGTGARQP